MSKNSTSETKSEQKQVFEVSIGGIPLKIKTAHDAATVQELVSYVDRKISEALPLTKSGSLQNAAVLACLNIAEEMILLKKKALTELDRFENKARRVVSHLESSRDQSVELDH